MDRVLIPGPFVLLIALAAGVDVQEPDILRTGTHEVEARWLHADQKPGLVRFETSSLRFRLDAVALGAARSYDFTAYRERTGPTDRRAALRIAEDGEVEAAWVEPQDGVRYLGPPYRTSALWAAACSLTVGGGALLDDTRLWHVAPLDPPALPAGATTRDTLRHRAERFGFLQSPARAEGDDAAPRHPGRRSPALNRPGQRPGGTGSGPGLLLRVGQTTTLGSNAWIDLRTADGWLVVGLGAWVS